MADLALASEALLQLLKLERHVRDRGIQLAGQEVAASVVREDLRQLAPLFRDELEHEQERDDPGIRLREATKVVMAGDFAPESRTLLAHPVLDERVANAIDQRNAARALDGFRYRPAGTKVVDDLRTRLFLQHRCRQQGGDEVAGHELPCIVDEEAPVAVAVEC